eukprot:scaffold4715_cov115-Cylindrotheca_fusiformis.AAC.6
MPKLLLSDKISFSMSVERDLQADGIPRTRALAFRQCRGYHVGSSPPVGMPLSRPRPKYAVLTAGLMMAASGTSVALSQEGGGDTVTFPPFEESVLAYDHYNGVTLHLDRLDDDHSPTEFAENLKQALDFWKTEGRKGIWVHAPPHKAHMVPHCVDQGFAFHFVREGTLILSQWLPEKTPSKLPFGPTHQVGIGALVLHPSDPSKMLVVQEKSGPAATWKLWKMPTGLLDPSEDIPEAAIRELREETGLDGTMNGIICFRQAHRPSSASDLFFVCRLVLKDPDAKWTPQEDEIAEIQWMSVEDYCNQQRWQGSPVYESLNDAIRQTSLAAQRSTDTERNGLITHERLPVGLGMNGTNALFKSQL